MSSDSTTLPEPPDEAATEDQQEPGSAPAAGASSDSAFEEDPPRAPASDEDSEALIVNVEGFEGPLDLLLALARTQKVDLKKISILALVEQYLEFVNEARRRRLELAADYLVMAAWLTYLKSRLLLPDEEEEDGPSGEEMAARLQFQLQRLEAMRERAAQLFARDRLGRDVFARGRPEAVRLVKHHQYKTTMFDLLTAYAQQRVRTAEMTYEYKRPPILLIEEARARIEKMLGVLRDWSSLDAILTDWGYSPLAGGDGATKRKRRSAMASALVASLELVRDGELEIRQLQPFAPVFIRPRTTPREPAPV